MKIIRWLVYNIYINDFFLYNLTVNSQVMSITLDITVDLPDIPPFISLTFD